MVTFCWSCAQQGAPAGGPRDEDPPVVVESDPPNYSTRFDRKKIEVTFDEYIVLDNVNQELVVSPPMEEKPEVKLRKRTLVIQFEEELKDSTTYTFNFGSAIKDLHEGNNLLNFEYVFSTGDVLDSLSVKGTLKYAEDLTVPEEPISIMLYTDLRDSVPLLDIPLYVGRSNDSGVFSVNNLKEGVYKVFAINDGNYNFLFDLPTEEIAFLDTSLMISAQLARALLDEADSLGTDTTKLSPEDEAISEIEPGGIEGAESELRTDTVQVLPDYNSIYIDLMLFTEETDIQYLMDNSRDDRRMLQMIFAQSLTDTFQYRILAQAEEGEMKVLEHFSGERDTLSLWIMDSLDYKKDTLQVEVNYTVVDTTLQYVTQTDTLRYIFRERNTRQRSREKPEVTEKLVISTIGKNKEHHLNSNLKLDLQVPFKEFHDSLITLFHIPDSVEIPVSYTLKPDSLLPTRAWIIAGWESLASYRLFMLPGAVESIYDMEHDTIDIPFKTRDIEYYGKILLTIQNVHHPVIVQLTSGDRVARQVTLYKDELYTFSYLVPGDYGIKCIHDINGNGKWDTGEYLEKRQPEPVEILSRKITVRSNWDHEVTMTLEK